jgi:hypothetical protein
LDHHFGSGANLSDLESEDISGEDLDQVDGLKSNDGPDSQDQYGNHHQNSIQRGIDAYRVNNIVSKTYLKQKAHNY